MAQLEAFIAYRHTGESEEVLEEMLGGVCRALGKTGVNAYCTFFAEKDFQAKQMNARQIMEHAFEVIDSKDILFVVQASESKSEGMIMEVGYCIAKQKPIIVATHESVQSTYLPQMANTAFTYSSLDDLESKIVGLDFAEIKSR